MARSTASASPASVPLAPGGVSSVDRALALLMAFSTAAPQLSLSELAERTQQYKSTVLRMLASLEFADLVRRGEDGRFSLGPAVARLHAAHAESFSIGDLVQPVLAQLVAATRESASFHVRQGGQALCLYRADSPHAVRDHLRAGDLQALARSAPGRVMQAYAGARGVRATRIRRDQLLLADGDPIAELAAIAVPVFAPDGGLVGVLALTMPSIRLDASHTTTVQRAARSLTARLGGHAPADARIRANPR